MELQGKIIAALDVKTGQSARGEWQVQEFVLETFDGQYSRKMVFSVFGSDRLQRFNIQVGQEVNVAFDIDAREYNGRWFNSIRAYDVRQIIPNQNPVGAPFPGSGSSCCSTVCLVILQPVSRLTTCPSDLTKGSRKGQERCSRRRSWPFRSSDLVPSAPYDELADAAHHLVLVNAVERIDSVA